MSEQEPVITVGGSASLDVDPELATLFFFVSVQERSRTDALRELATTLESLMALVRDYPHEKIDQGPVSMQVLVKEKRSRASVASVRLVVTFASFERLGDLVLRAGERDRVSVTGPVWRLRPDSPAFARAKREAALDAKLAARQYAEAFGCGLTALLELSDRPFDWSSAPRGGAENAAPRGAMRGVPSSVADEVTLDFTPVRQTVTASVTARFSMTAPDLTS